MGIVIGSLIYLILPLGVALWIIYYCERAGGRRFRNPITLLVQTIAKPIGHGALAAVQPVLAVVLVCATWFLYIAAIVVPVYIVWHLMERGSR
jgi:hypothetical protein